MKAVQSILSSTRNPHLASPSDAHTYDDKFALVELTSTIAISALCNAFEGLGLDKSKLSQLVNVVKDDEEKNVTLRFSANEKCSFVKEDTIEITHENPHQTVVQEEETKEVSTKNDDDEEGASTTTSKTTTKTTTNKIVSKVKQYHWKVEIEYTIDVIVSGGATNNETKDGEEEENNNQSNNDNKMVLVSKTASCEIITRGAKKSKFEAFKKFVPSRPLTVSLTWLLRHIQNTDPLEVKLEIDRNVESCRTPMNNAEMDNAQVFFQEIVHWCHGVSQYLVNKEKEVMSSGIVQDEDADNNSLCLQGITADGIFNPVLPLFQSNHNDSSPLLSNGDVNLFLAEQYRTILCELKSIRCSTNNDDSNIMSSAEVVIVKLNRHVVQIAEFRLHSIKHVENMLYCQLYDAIGKSVSSHDFTDYVSWRNDVLFSDEYGPKPFCYAIRRPNHFPDGMISIEERYPSTNLSSFVKEGGSNNINAKTFTRKLDNDDEGPKINIPINSATTVEFTGDRYLHGWMMQRFQNKSSFALTARARQFSCFLLLVGNLSGPDTFQPQHGIILQNKDEILIPLLLEETPSAREFKDAVASLSPEQRRFAEAFRNMKLSSSVFGICVVQLKPQLETLLSLPPKSLTKEIRLTQDLLSLFIDFQVPSDLLSYDGPDEIDASEKVEVVKRHVKNVLDMVKDSKERDLSDTKMRAEMSSAKYVQGNPSAAASGGGFGFGSAPGALFGSGSPAHAPTTKGFFAATGPAGGKGACETVPTSITFGAPAPRPRASFCASAPVPCVPPGADSFGASPTSTLATAKQSGVSATPASENTTTAPTQPTISNEVNELQDTRLHNDLTKMPKRIDARFEQISKDDVYGGTVRSTTLKTNDHLWTKKFQANLLSTQQSVALNSTMLKTEKDKAFDLLDALSRSGSLPIAFAELHVIVASTHCFEKSVVNTVVRDNVNPIEKIETSNLLLASVIHNVSLKELLRKEEEIERIANVSPSLISDFNSET